VSDPHQVTNSTLSREVVEQRSAEAHEPGWLRERRAAAWEAFLRLPLPPSADEEWRRTDLSALDLDALVPLGGGAPRREKPPEALLRLVGDPLGASAIRFVVNGIEVQARVAPELAAQGIVFTSLADAVRSHGDLVRPHFGSIVRDDENKYRALHGALWAGGTFLYVPDDVEVDLPLVTATHLDRDGVLYSPHTLVVAGARSRVTLVELSQSTEGRARTLVNPVVELIPKAGAQLRYVNLEDWGRNVWETGMVRTVVERDATVNSLMVAFGAGLVKTNVESRLAAPGGTSEMLGVQFGDRTQHFDYHTLQEHAAPSTTSDLLYKGALKDKARSVFSGLIRADAGAQKTNAFQLNRNLILSEGARADSMPKLEILANDLRCTHGASTSRLNEEQIFYLMSRGLRRAAAVRMMVDGFFAEIFDRIPLEMIRERLSRAIEQKMGDYV